MRLLIRSFTVILLVITSGCISSVSTFGGDPLEVLTSKQWDWDWEDKTCQIQTHAIFFDEAEQKLTFKWLSENPDYVLDDTVYTVNKIEGPKLYLDMIGEDRYSSARELVSWTLVVKDEDTYCWHRSDWMPFICTRHNLSCSG